MPAGPQAAEEAVRFVVGRDGGGIEQHDGDRGERGQVGEVSFLRLQRGKVRLPRGHLTLEHDEIVEGLRLGEQAAATVDAGLLGRDPRVEIRERQLQDFTVVKLHSFYVRYRLPMWIEVQCFEWAPGFDAQRTTL